MTQLSPDLQRGDKTWSVCLASCSSENLVFIGGFMQCLKLRWNTHIADLQPNEKLNFGCSDSASSVHTLDCYFFVDIPSSSSHCYFLIDFPFRLDPDSMSHERFASWVTSFCVILHVNGDWKVSCTVPRDSHPFGDPANFISQNINPQTLHILLKTAKAARKPLKKQTKFHRGLQLASKKCRGRSIK